MLHLSTHAPSLQQSEGGARHALRHQYRKKLDIKVEGVRPHLQQSVVGCRFCKRSSINISTDPRAMASAKGHPSAQLHLLKQTDVDEVLQEKISQRR